MQNPSGHVTSNPYEKRLIILLKIVAAVYAVSLLGYLLPGLIFPLKNTFVPPFVINSVVKIGLLSAISLFAASNVKRFKVLISFLIFANILAVISGVLLLIFGNTSGEYDLLFGKFSTGQLIWGSMIADGITAGLIFWFSASAEKERYNLKYFTPGQFRTLQAIAEIVVTGDELILTSEDVAKNVDKYMGSFKAKSKWITQVVLTGMYFYPLLTFNSPFPYMSREKREKFIKKRFYREITMRLVPEFWRTLVQAMIRMAKQLSYLGYYNDRRTFVSINYKPFSERMPDLHTKNFPSKERIPLKVESSKEINADEINGDIVIIGSGAGASVMANSLIKKGRQVLMLERGDFVDPSTFNEDEVDMLSRLYADGALQLSRDFRFQVLQGSCVGGTTVVNNAVCFDLPDDVLSKWNSSPYDVSIDSAELKKSFKNVRELISVGLMNNSPSRKDFLNHGAQVFSDGVEKLKLNLSPNISMEVEANIVDCLGCGYCNIGCKYGKKMSMLDTVLPKIQKEYGEKSLRIIAGCEALKFKTNGKKVSSLTCRLSDGKKVEVKANTFIVAAGAVSSSILLLNSGIGKNAGKNLSFNMGSPLTALFNQPVNAYDGLQISHFLKVSPNPGFIIETWYNPPVAQALTMPGWFEDHYNNMKKYDKLSCTGVLVPTESNGEVRTAGLTGREVRFIPTEKDLNTLLNGLMLSGEIFFAAGAQAVMPATFKYYEIKNMDQLKKLKEYVKDPSDITLGTGHPQGGNILSGNENIGVVNPEFKVFGYDNLYLCDASVFPTSLGVNPQLTVMALADYASRFVNGK